MTPIKQEAIQIIQDMPEESTLDDIIYELHFKAQIDAGLRDIEEGRVVPHEEVKKRLEKWLTK